MSKSIPVTPEHFAIVDDEDYEWLSQFTWYLKRRADRSDVYAMTSLDEFGSFSRANVGTHDSLMHKMITGFEMTDHVDGNGLNNQRFNLRSSTHTTNGQNSDKRQNTSSAFKGVCWHKASSRWHAKIKVNRKTVSLRYFRNEEDAAEAYDEAARFYFGEFARLNFPNDGEQGCRTAP